MTDCTSGLQEVAEVIKLFALCWSAFLDIYRYFWHIAGCYLILLFFFIYILSGIYNILLELPVGTTCPEAFEWLVSCPVKDLHSSDNNNPYFQSSDQIMQASLHTKGNGNDPTRQWPGLQTDTALIQLLGLAWVSEVLSAPELVGLDWYHIQVCARYHCEFYI